MRFNKETSIFLDLIRGLSAQMVLAGHLYSYCVHDSPGVFYFQNLGVLIFFMLSGLFITYTALNKGRGYGMGRYVTDRFTRIFISYIPALFLILLIDFIAIRLNPAYAYRTYFTVTNFLGNLLMLENHPLLINALGRKYPVFNIVPFGSGRPLWSVAMEWWLYLCFGIMYYARLTWRNTIVWLLLLIVPVYHLLTSPMGSTLITLWVCGFMAFFLLKNKIVHFRSPLLIATGLFLIAVLRLHFTNNEVYDVTFGLLLFAAIFLVIQDLTNRPERYGFLRRIEKPSRFLSFFSFSLYLLHFSLMSLMLELNLDLSPWGKVAVFFIVCNAAGWLLAYCTERHYHRLASYLKARLWKNSKVREGISE